jgi:FkbM family methyltransferase
MLQTLEFKSIASVLAAKPEGVWFRDPHAPLVDSMLFANDMPIRGVIHLGASWGQEVWLYMMLGFRRALMVEPLPLEFKRLAERCSATTAYSQAVKEMIGPGARPPIEFHCVQCAVADRSGQSTFFQTEESATSSLFQPAKSASAEIEVETRTLDDLMSTLPAGWSAEDFTYLRMNIQGSELLALKGGERALRHVRGIFLEVNVRHRYENQPAKEDFDRLLGDLGFECTLAVASVAHGNLFYRRR